MTEQWARIPGFPNYEISNLGQVVRIGKTKRIPVKVNFAKNYIYICLTSESHESKQVNVRSILDKCFSDHVYKDRLLADLDGEVWKDVVGWEDFYQVSNLGRIKTKERVRTGKFGSNYTICAKLKEAYTDEDGYLRVSLYKNNSTKLLGVHRVVAEAFISNPNNLPQVNHCNGIKTDNRVENLEWTTNLKNIQHSIKLGLRNPSNRYSIIRLSDGQMFNSATALHSEIGGSYNEIVHLLNTTSGDIITFRGVEYRFQRLNGGQN